jgi:hypothetical protein
MPFIAGNTGTIKVKIHSNPCKVPVAVSFIEKVSKTDRNDLKRKTAEC